MSIMLEINVLLCESNPPPTSVKPDRKTQIWVACPWKTGLLVVGYKNEKKEEKKA